MQNYLVGAGATRMAVLDFFGFCLQLAVVTEPLNHTTSTITTTTRMFGLEHSCEVTSWLVHRTGIYRML